jgi:hypothetical protein
MLKLRHFNVIASLIFMALLTISPTLQAQLSTRATITGTVTDATGAVVTGATVTITDEATKVAIQTESNSSGSYVAPGLNVATYSVAMSKAGFKSYTVTGIELHPAATTTVNGTLAVGSTTQSVTVAATAALVETSTPETSASIASAQVSTLPMNGRNYQGLATLMPGVQNTSAGSALTTGGRSTNSVLSVNGLQANKSFYALDGVWNENTGNMAQTSVVPNPDSLEEVRVLQNNFSAQYSLMGSSVVLLQTKSGSANFHGTMWEFLRNDDLNSKNYFATSILPYKQNIFGYNLGGPVFIPKVYNADRQKTFFFWSEQWVILHQASTLTGITPTANQRAGIFNSPINNPATGTLFSQNAGGQYVVTGINANAAAYLSTLYPASNYSNGSQNYINTTPAKTNQRDDEIKIDHSFSPRLHALGEFLDEYQEYAQNSLNGSQSGEIFSSNSETDYTHNKLAQLSLTQILSPNMVNTTNIAMNIFLLQLNLVGKTDISQIPGFTESLPFSGYLSTRIPLVTFSGGIAPQGIAAARPLPHAADLDDTVGDNWSWLKGRHFLQAGVSIVFNTKRQNVGSATNGQFTFSGNFTKPSSNAVTQDDALADFLLGDATTFTQTSNEPHGVVHGFSVSPYVEDRMKLGKNLTFTIGARLYYMPLPHGPVNSETNFVPSAYSALDAPIVNNNGTITLTPTYSTTNGLLFNSGATGGLPDNFSNAHRWYVGPDAGFAWDVFGDGATSLRGGYGISYTRIFTNQDCSFSCASNAPVLQSANLQNASFPAVVGTGTAKATSIASLSAADQNIQASPVASYSLGLEHRFRGNFIASATGAASQIRHMVGTWNYNAAPHSGNYDFDPTINAGAITPYAFSPYQGYAAISTLATRQSQHWDALELLLEHPVSQSLFATVAYTYSHDLTNYASGSFNVIDPYNPSRYHGNVEGLNYPQSMAITAIYTLPWLQHSHGAESTLLGGWRFSDITTIRSGTSLAPALSISNQGNAVRPDRVANTTTNGPKTKAQWFNTAAFTAPAAGYYGNSGIGVIRGPGLVGFDMSLFKEFHFAESNFFEFRAESFNTFNHTNFTSVSTTYGSSSFGQVTAAADPRILEFSLRYKF